MEGKKCERERTLINTGYDNDWEVYVVDGLARYVDFYIVKKYDKYDRFDIELCNINAIQHSEMYTYVRTLRPLMSSSTCARVESELLAATSLSRDHLAGSTLSTN